MMFLLQKNIPMLQKTTFSQKKTGTSLMQTFLLSYYYIIFTFECSFRYTPGESPIIFLNAEENLLSFS